MATAITLKSNVSCPILIDASPPQLITTLPKAAIAKAMHTLMNLEEELS